MADVRRDAEKRIQKRTQKQAIRQGPWKSLAYRVSALRKGGGFPAEKVILRYDL
jgi:hypothetical protein